MSIAKSYEDRQKAHWWIKTANGLMLSAKLSWDALDPLLWSNPKKFGPIHQVVAYWNSFLLLTAFAFENLYRKTPPYVPPSGHELWGKRCAVKKVRYTLESA